VWAWHRGAAGFCKRQMRRTLCLSLAAHLVLMPALPAAQADDQPTIDLYVDENTGQVFTKPGPGRSRLGTFKRVDGPAEAPAVAPAAAPPVAPAAPVPAAPAPVAPAAPVPVPVEAVPAPAPAPVQAEAPAPEVQKAEVDQKAVADAVNKSLAQKWYERLSIRGYVQMRYTSLIDYDGEAEWFHPADRSVRDGAGLFIRRARLILSGDISDHVYVYLQPDFNALPADGDFSVQLRDAYADVSFDKAKEYRVRFGQSKVPFGWVNLQSSQNRIPLERPEAFNYAVEGERDVGIFFYWAPAEIRERFKYLVRSGLKGSGDYGVVGFGIYNGQGLNRLDVNNNFHLVGRLTYPFQLEGGQFIEPGIQGYIGRFEPRLAAIGDPPMTPTVENDGVIDRRLAASTVIYPQPFGLETEWVIGEGPELVNDDSIQSKFLWGGYVQGYYMYPFRWGIAYPFVRWQYYDGGRKFARDAPPVDLNEWDFGLEWAVLPELEFTAVYSFTPKRTNSNQYPYLEIEDGSRVGMQVQWNY